jgi:hypothetical protein
MGITVFCITITRGSAGITAFLSAKCTRGMCCAIERRRAGSNTDFSRTSDRSKAGLQHM